MNTIMIRSLPGNSMPLLRPTSSIPLFFSSQIPHPRNSLSTSNSMDNYSAVHHLSIPQEAQTTVQSLAAQWPDVPHPHALHVIPLKGALTNQVYQIIWPCANPNTHRKVLLRIYGAGVDVFFNRQDEIRTFEFMSNQGCGPRLLARFPNGRVEEFIRARTLTAPDLRDPQISALIATKMNEFHNLDMPGFNTPLLWNRLRNWLKEAKRPCPVEEVEEFQFSVLEDEILMLQNHLDTSQQPVGFCHNDLQYGNIMMDEETRLITIIDYEYASYNPVAFDIATHFCEMAANYHTQTPHVLDYSQYPSLEERERFVRIYLSCSGKQPGDLEVNKLVQDVERYTLASHLLWGLWGIISYQVNKIDFDYKEYARQRFQQYWSNKSRLLEL